MNLSRLDLGLESRLYELYCSNPRYVNNPTMQNEWGLVGIFETKNNLPHRCCIAYHEIFGVTGPIRSELMILTGLMASNMRREAYREHKVIPVRICS